MTERKYWQADEETSTKIIAYLADEQRVKEEGLALAGQYGADTERIYTTRVFGNFRVCGFVFSDATKVNTNLFQRLHDTNDGWKPRITAGKERRLLSTAFNKLQTQSLTKIMQLVGMNPFKGHLWRTPGLKMAGKVIFLSLPADIKPKHCTRVSDLDFENALSKKPQTKTGAKTKKKQEA